MHQTLLKNAGLAALAGGVVEFQTLAESSSEAGGSAEELHDLPVAVEPERILLAPAEFDRVPDVVGEPDPPQASEEDPTRHSAVPPGQSGFETFREPGPAAAQPPVSPGWQFAPVPLRATPVAAVPRLSSAARAFRPRRRVVVPAHRARPAAVLRLSNEAISAWPAPVASRPCSKSLLPVVPRPQQSSSPAPVVVFSFMEDAAAGGSSRSGIRPDSRTEQRIRQSSQDVPVPLLFSLPESPFCWPRASTRLRRIPARVADPKPQRLGLDPGSGGRRFAPAGPGELWDQQAAAVQPFRLHRMPLRPLRLKPVRLPGSAGYSSPPSVRFAFINALHLPRPVTTPFRPVYRWVSPASPAAGGRPQAGGQATGFSSSSSAAKLAAKDDRR